MKRRLTPGLSVAVALILGGAALPAAAAGQGWDGRDRPEPVIELRRSGEATQDAASTRSVILYVTPPAGWAVYAPASESADAAPDAEVSYGLGLPLSAEDEAGRPVSLTGARPPELKETAWGRAHVYTTAAAFHLGAFGVDWRPVMGERRLVVRWAICRDDLCVPGRTRVVLD